MNEAALEQQRAELCRQLDDTRRQIAERRTAPPGEGDFPRSLTMRALMFARPDLVHRMASIAGALVAGVRLAKSIGAARP